MSINNLKAAIAAEKTKVKTRRKMDVLVEAFAEAIAATGQDEADALARALSDWARTYHRSSAAARRQSPLLREILSAVEETLDMRASGDWSDHNEGPLPFTADEVAAAVAAVDAEDRS